MFRWPRLASYAHRLVRSTQPQGVEDHRRLPSRQRQEPPADVVEPAVKPPVGRVDWNAPQLCGHTTSLFRASDRDPPCGKSATACGPFRGPFDCPGRIGRLAYGGVDYKGCLSITRAVTWPVFWRHNDPKSRVGLRVVDPCLESARVRRQRHRSNVLARAPRPSRLECDPAVAADARRWRHVAGLRARARVQDRVTLRTRSLIETAASKHR
jgi:hypothetical protein